ncbi:hypothetical protein [Georhizobium profundi]|uniref:hypothetical protein n=1 Tax=Georhizobium profundi TaxID=2341112 RepID=UPI0013E0AEE5|nr:hypothetical protein [Georhizobium profundi]
MTPEFTLLCVLLGAGVALLYGGAAGIVGADSARERAGGSIVFAAGVAVITIICWGTV